MIHQYKLNGFNVVIDVYSGSIHVVDDVAYDIIRLFCEKKETDGRWPSPSETEDFVKKLAGEGTYGQEGLDNIDSEEIGECHRDVLALIDGGKLFSEDVFRINASAIKERNTDIKALCLHVSHACDLTCSYCFAGQGRFNGPSALMTADVGKRAIDFLVENSGSHRNLEVDFFGGEPLLNFDVVKEIVEYSRSLESLTNKRFRFTLTTNGMGITDEVIDFVNRECHNVVLSLDGRKVVHDRERKTASGEGSYDIVVPKFQRLVAARTGKDCGPVKFSELPENLTKGSDTGNTSYYIRGTFTHYNPDFTEDIFHMVDLGFTELSMEPVVSDPDSRFALTENDLNVLYNQYEKLAVEMIERTRANHLGDGVASDGSSGKSRAPFTFYHYMLDLGRGPCIYKRISGCGSGTEYFAVTPAGELYPCHQFVGDEKYLMGDIWSGVEIRDEFKMCNVYARPECEDCWAKLYCSGGCAANSYHASGSILGTYDYGCKLFKKRIECAIMMKAAEADAREMAGEADAREMAAEAGEA